MSGEGSFGDRVDDLVRLALGEPDAVAAAVRAQADQVLKRFADALRAGSSYEDRISALTETYMHGALQHLAAAARGDRIEFAEAEVVASSVAASMDRATTAAWASDTETVSAAMLAAESLLEMDFSRLYDLLL
jgi:hypothetical protein